MAVLFHVAMVTGLRPACQPPNEASEASALALATAGGVGAGIGALLPRHTKDLIYSAK